jgi:hypothetical protein
MATALLNVPVLEPGFLMPDDKPKTQSVKLATDVVESARVVAALRGVSMTDMISDFLRPTLAKWESEEIQKRASAMPKPANGPKSGG